MTLLQLIGYTHHDQTITAELPKANKAALEFIFAVILLDLVGLTVLIPVLAFIVRQYSDDALMVTLMTVIYAAARVLRRAAAGRSPDRYGRRPVLLLSTLGSAFGYYLFGVGGALWVLLLSRLIDGITGGNLSTAAAYIADVTPRHERAKSFALLGAAFGLGFILGPALGGLLSQISTAAPACAAGALSLLSAIVGFFVLPEVAAQGAAHKRAAAPGRDQPICADRRSAAAPGAERPAADPVPVYVCGHGLQ